jgi:polysaccharide deacetylase family protein (PEP-CTERM system associated)
MGTSENPKIKACARAERGTLNAITVDVEDYFHVEAFASSISPENWQKYELRVENNVERILELFSRYQVKATFFILGWVAERIPGLAGCIAGAGHELGCHGYAHQHIHRQSPSEFREDVQRARRLLMDQTGQSVQCYRAPSFSITSKTLWALDILAEEGFTVDSSIFPAQHDLYGIADAPRFLHRRNGLIEFPPTTIRKAKTSIGAAGGGYLRLFPYLITRWAIRHINEVEGQPAMVYFHPWEIDREQPRIAAPLKSRLRHYTNLEKMFGKIERLLQDFHFSTVSDVCAAANQLI